MNPTHDEENLIRWLDGEMDEAERARFEARLATDPVLHAEAMEMKKLSTALQTHLPQADDIPNADFFNSQIQRSIEEMRQTEHRSGEREPAGLLGWLRLPWLIAGASAALALLVMLRPLSSGDTTQVVNSYAPDPKVQVRVMEATNANAVVLMLEGLPEIPATTPMVGFKVHRTETDPQMAMTTLFSDDEKVLLVLAKDGLNQPKVYAR